MHKHLLIVIIAILAASSVAGQGTAAEKLVDSVNLEVTMLNQDPDPVEPGNFVDVRFKIENNGLDFAEDVVIELLPSYPFAIEPGASAVKEVGNLGARQDDDEGVIVKYRLLVDINAVEGENELRLRYKHKDISWIIPDEDTYQIDVQTNDAILNVRSIKVEPERVPPGGTAKVTVEFENLADSVLKDITTKLNLNNAPLATFGSVDEQTIELINANKRQTISYNIIAEPEAEANLYKIPLEINYFDEISNAYNRSYTFGILIGSEPDVVVSIDSSEIHKKAQTGEVVVRVVNKGLNDIKFANLIIEEVDHVTVITPLEVYIGNIDSDDFETAEYNMRVSSDADGNVLLPVRLEYKDATNQPHVLEEDLELRLYSMQEAKELGLEQENGAIGVIVIVVVIAVGIFFYWRWRKRKKR